MHNMNYTIQTVRRIAKKTNYPGDLKDIREGVLNTLIDVFFASYPEVLAAEVARMEKTAVNAYTSRGDAGDEKYSKIFDTLEYIFKVKGITFDYGVGLYPTFEIPTNDGIKTEYSPLNAIRCINGYWDKK